MAAAVAATNPAGPPKLTNLYYARTVGTAKPCYICSKETTVCLATLDVQDFVYTCQSHLADPGFARPVDPPAPVKDPVPQSEIDKIKKEYEEKQKAKADKGKGKEKDGEDKAKVASPAPTPSPAATPAPAASHKKYILHRDIFAMRTDLHRKKYLAKQANERAGGLPVAPIGFPTLPGASKKA